jgi:hypothetical protein
MVRQAHHEVRFCPHPELVEGQQNSYDKNAFDDCESKPATEFKIILAPF